MAEPQQARRCGTWQLDEAAPPTKLAASPALAERLRRDCVGEFAATVRVGRADYVPEGARLRMRLGPCLFTADIPLERLAELEADADVVSIQPASRLGLP